LQAFLDYLKLEKNYSKHTLQSYSTDLAQFSRYLERYEGTFLPLKVDSSQVSGWIAELSESGITHRSINRKISSLRAFYGFLLKTGVLASNPMKDIRRLKQAQTLQLPLSEEELEHLFNDVQFPEGFEGSRDRLVLELLYACGLRRNELIELKVSDIQVRDRLLRVLGKRNKERIVPLLDSVINCYRTYWEHRSKLESTEDMEYLLLTARGRKLNNSLVYRRINSYLHLISTKSKRSPHIIRHSFATHLLRNGADLQTIKELLGHCSLASTQVYAHNNISELQKVHRKFHPRNK